MSICIYTEIHRALVYPAPFLFLLLMLSVKKKETCSPEIIWSPKTCIHQPLIMMGPKGENKGKRNELAAQPSVNDFALFSTRKEKDS